jgi:hypothetical protein
MIIYVGCNKNNEILLGFTGTGAKGVLLKSLNAEFYGDSGPLLPLESCFQTSGFIWFYMVLYGSMALYGINQV